MSRPCKECGDVLIVGKNWTESRKKNWVYVCKPCWNNYYQEYSWRSKYGISRSDYNEWFHSQNGACGICNIHQSELKNSLAVDHDHETGKVRGLLCTTCNTGLGKLGDSIEGLEAAIEYLKES